MTVTDLAAWLTAQLDLDQAHAEKDLWALARASQGRWSASYGYNLPYSLILVDGVKVGRLTATRGPLPDGAEDQHAADAFAVARLVQKAKGRAEAALRTVAGHRAILERHQRTAHFDEIWMCRKCGNAGWPCRDVRDLASIYQDRVGFDPSWK